MTAQKKAPSGGNREGAEIKSTPDNEVLPEHILPIVSRMRQDVTARRQDNGVPVRTSDPISATNLRAHLGGGNRVGQYFSNAGADTVKAAVFDLDSHKGDVSWKDMVSRARKLTKLCRARGLIPLPFRSSGGNGIHLWFLWSEEQDAYSVRALMREILEDMGFTDGAGGLKAREIEIFPKQDSVRENGYVMQTERYLRIKSNILFQKHKKFVEPPQSPSGNSAWGWCRGGVSHIEKGPVIAPGLLQWLVWNESLGFLFMQRG